MRELRTTYVALTRENKHRDGEYFTFIGLAEVDGYYVIRFTDGEESTVPSDEIFWRE
jgi:hypothetical protein